MIGGGGRRQRRRHASGNVMEALLAMLLSDKIEGALGAGAGMQPRSSAAEALRQNLQARIAPQKG